MFRIGDGVGGVTVLVFLGGVGSGGVAASTLLDGVGTDSERT